MSDHAQARVFILVLICVAVPIDLLMTYDALPQLADQLSVDHIFSYPCTVEEEKPVIMKPLLQPMLKFPTVSNEMS